MRPDIVIYATPYPSKKHQPLVVKLVDNLPYGMHTFLIFSMDEHGATYSTSLNKLGIDLTVEFMDIPHSVQLSVNGVTHFISKSGLLSSNLLSLLHKLIDV